MIWKPVLIPELSYEAVKAYAEAHGLKICETMQKLLFNWTLSFWSDPECYGVPLVSSKEVK